jgi:hypothetical protein
MRLCLCCLPPGGNTGEDEQGEALGAKRQASQGGFHLQMVQQCYSCGAPVPALSSPASTATASSSTAGRALSTQRRYKREVHE